MNQFADKSVQVHAYALRGIPLSLFAFAVWGGADLVHGRSGVVLSLHVLGWIMMVCGIGLILAAMFKTQKLRGQLLRYADGRCPTCGYDLRATPHRCPECGFVIATLIPDVESPASS